MSVTGSERRGCVLKTYRGNRDGCEVHGPAAGWPCRVTRWDGMEPTHDSPRRPDLFVAPDANGDLTLWKEALTGPHQPVALARECDVHPVVWARAIAGLLGA